MTRQKIFLVIFNAFCEKFQLLVGCKGTRKKSKWATKNTMNILQRLNKVIDTFLESNNSEYESEVI